MENEMDKSEFRNESITVMLNEKEKASFALFCLEELKMAISTGGRLIIKEFMGNWKRWYKLEQDLVETTGHVYDFRKIAENWFNRLRYERQRRNKLIKLLKQNNIEIPKDVLLPYSAFVKGKKCTGNHSKKSV